MDSLEIQNDPFLPSWYAIHCRSRHEAKVETGLLHRGLETFLPRMVIRSRRRDRKALLEVPLFPGYLFAYMRLEPVTFREVVMMPGVLRILGVTGHFIPVPAEKIASIRTIVESSRPYYPYPYLDRGMRVRIIEGPLSGATGIILQRRDKKRRLVVGVELFCRAVAVELADEAIEPYD
jgi:transcriptional antiterminator NusG